jgi:hypothetical protein
MVQMIRNAASARGLRVQPTDKGTEILIKVRGAVGGGTKYPWAEWFNGTLWLIEKGADYTVETDKMPGKLKKEARRLYKIVQISHRDADGNKLADSLIIRAHDMTAAERVAEDLRRAEQKKGKASGVDLR